MTDSVFTRIIRGEIPCHKVYEDDQTIVFMDIHPVQPGHVLVVPKTPVANFYELTQVDAAALWAVVQKVGLRLHEVFPQKKRIGMMVEGLDVEHAHVHLLPIDTDEDYRTPQDMDGEPDHAALARLAEQLKF